MKVRVLQAHDNAYGVGDNGERYHKRVGMEYEIGSDQDAQTLIDGGYIEEVSDGDDEAGRSARAGSSAGRATEGDSSERTSAGAKKSR